MPITPIMSLALAPIVLSAALAAPVEQTINYQGRLDRLDEPVDGRLRLLFDVWDASFGGSLVATREEPSLLITDGVFTTEIPVDGAFFNGEQRWIEITVDDGVNPPEPLEPRLPLRPAPQSIYSITSGVTLGEVVANGSVAELLPGQTVRFEDAGGDARVSLGATADGGEFSVRDENGAEAVAVRADTNGSGGEITVRSGGPGSTSGVIIDGNNFNTGSPQMSLIGPGGSIRLDPLAVGDQSAQLLEDAVSSFEMLDEPGLTGPSGVFGAVDVGEFAQIEVKTLNSPGPGYVMAVVSTSLRQGTGGPAVTSDVQMALSDDPVEFFLPDYSVELPAFVLTGDPVEIPVTVTEVFEVESAGLKTIYFQARLNAGPGPVGFNNTNLTLLYFPTSYDGSRTVSGGPQGGEPPMDPLAEIGALRARLTDLERRLGGDD